MFITKKQFFVALEEIGRRMKILDNKISAIKMASADTFDQVYDDMNHLLIHLDSVGATCDGINDSKGNPIKKARKSRTLKAKKSK